jgi:hypothetical protein
MLEIILIIFLSKKIGQIAEEKKQSKALFKFMFVVLWILGEFIGAIIGLNLTKGLTVYLFALIGAALGAIISFAIVNNLKNMIIEECTVIDEKLIVYDKTHESLGILTELEIGSKYSLYLNKDFGRFYQICLANGQIGFILKSSRYSKQI